MVEAGGQRIRGFRHGPDYAFIHAVDSGADAERVIPRCKSRAILVSAPGSKAVGGSMSLYRAGLRLALFLPLGVAMPPRKGAVRFRRCELRFHSVLAD